MQSTLSVTGDTAILRCRGEFDLATRMELAAGLVDLGSSRSTTLVVDLSDVTFLDCGSVSAIRAFSHRAGGDRRVIVACPPGLPRRVLALTGFDQVHPVLPTLAEAVSLPADA